MSFDIISAAKSLSEPLTEIVKACRSAIGVVYEPTRLREQARAEADAAIIRLQSEIEQNDIRSRAECRRQILEINRQFNLERITLALELELAPETKNADYRAPTANWTAQFVECAQDAYEEDLQALWARVLASEIASPSSVSPRTLHFLHLLSKEEAEYFQEFCSYVWSTSDGETGIGYFHTPATTEHLKAKGVLYSKLLRLDSLGLISFNSNSTLQFNQEMLFFSYHGKDFSFRFRRDAQGKFFPIFCIPLTHIGIEVHRLVMATGDDDYIEILRRSLAPLRIDVSPRED